MRPIGAPESRNPSFCHATPGWLLALLLGAGSCAAPPDEAAREGGEAISATPPPVQTPVIHIGRSVAVTDLPTLEATDARGRVRFSLERVLGYIAATSGDTHGLDAIGLYTRVFDTNNTKATGHVADGQHCDDQKDANGNAVLNGLPIECPRQEGALADIQTHNPFCSGAGCDPYTPVAITNRFDLAAVNGQTCGQYRIVFAKGVQHSPLETAGNPLVLNRNMMIFEAVMPNPRPQLGLAGCAKVVQFWAGLSNIDDPAQRAEALDRFFFAGIPSFPPAFDFGHFSGADDPTTGEQLGGQVRANQFMNDPQTGGGGQMWQLREYNLRRTCSGNGKNKSCKAAVEMVPTRFNPPSSLFDENDQSPLALAFRDPLNKSGFISQVKNLAQDDVNIINMNGLSREFNNGQSTSSPLFDPTIPPADDTNYNMMFNPSGPFAANIGAALAAMGSTLTPSDIVRRAQTQACAGCHELATSTAPFFGGVPGSNQLGGGLVWPDAAAGPAVEIAPDVLVRLNAFTQISDSLLVPLTDGVTCDTACTAHAETCQCAWAVSPALADAFLPFRGENMSKFLKGLHGSHDSH